MAIAQLLGGDLLALVTALGGAAHSFCEVRDRARQIYYHFLFFSLCCLECVWMMMDDDENRSRFRPGREGVVERVSGFIVGGAWSV